MTTTEAPKKIALESDLRRIARGEHPVAVFGGDEARYSGGVSAHACPAAAVGGGTLCGVWSTVALDADGTVLHSITTRVQS